jgi:hypothetical protein
MKLWEKKAHELIYDLCFEEYKKVNRDKRGIKKKKHIPYRPPELAEELHNCIKNEDEERAKFIFLTRF